MLYVFCAITSCFFLVSYFDLLKFSKYSQHVHEGIELIFEVVILVSLIFDISVIFFSEIFKIDH